MGLWYGYNDAICGSRFAARFAARRGVVTMKSGLRRDLRRGSRRRKTREWLQCRRHRKTPAVCRAAEVVTIKAAPQEMRPYYDHITFFLNRLHS